MARLAAYLLPGLIALLSACATTVEPTPSPSGAPASSPVPSSGARTPAAQRRTPQFDWLAERDRISRDLAGLADIAVRVRDDGALQLMLPGADAFTRGGTEPRPALRATLDRIAAVLVPAKQVAVQVYGHTDSMDSELHNLQLSIARAETVAEHLRNRGIAFVRLQADGKGESEPIADNATEAGRAMNRRVEIVLRPLE